jgi:hypothetical protein
LEGFWERKDVNNSNDNRTAISVKIFRGSAELQIPASRLQRRHLGQFLKVGGRETPISWKIYERLKSEPVSCSKPPEIVKASPE